jgi:hypothetical protein
VFQFYPGIPGSISKATTVLGKHVELSSTNPTNMFAKETTHHLQRDAEIVSPKIER